MTDALEALCARTLQDHNQQQDQQQEEEEHPPARSTDSELRQFIIDSGLVDEDESLSQALHQLEDMCTQALQEEEEQTPTAMEG